jgi:KUP system potassium uptake protein
MDQRARWRPLHSESPAMSPSNPPKPSSTAAEDPRAPRRQGLAALTLAAVGVVYGDIGTSPLYTIKEIFAAHTGVPLDAMHLVGALSSVLWALMLVVTLKYVVLILRADNHGEGGGLALTALAARAVGERPALRRGLLLLGVFGATLFYGDSIITPAISVLGAMEGLELVTPALKPYVVPASGLILVALFAVQRRGSAFVGRFFGPVIVLWFLTLGVAGALHIARQPAILAALNPLQAWHFGVERGWGLFAAVGAIVLALTGAEALYADMGHFGRKPIQFAWIFFVLPALLLNYYGQGAFILSDLSVARSEDFSPFFQLAPTWGVIPLILLSTIATVIASQAVITGAYSIVRQAIQLGLLPRMVISHTSDIEGQIYVPRINRLLLVGVLLLVSVFKSSDSLANAYGIAVTGTMCVTTALAFVVVWKLWKWPVWAAVLFVGCFLAVDLSFLAANLVKVFEGGWVPLLLGGSSMVAMWTWVRGTHLLAAKTGRDSIPLADLMRMLNKSKPTRVPGTAVFLTSALDVAPSALMHNLKHNKVLHERIVLMSVKTLDRPRVADEHRYEIQKLSDDFYGVTLYFGFMESPRVPAALTLMRKAGHKFDIMTTSFFLGRRSLKTSATSEMPHWQDRLFVVLSKQSANATEFFAIPSDRVVELGAQVSI